MLSLLFCGVFCGVGEFRISHLNALLRFRDDSKGVRPFFTITAEGGCVNWTSLDTTVVRVTPNYEPGNCSRSAVVESVATGSKRRSTAVVANSSSGGSLKCDVFVDSIHNISILTTTRTIYVGSSLEALSVQGRDSENNLFTSLSGLSVQWTIDTDHLGRVEPEDAQLAISEMSGHVSGSVIVKGTHVGRAWVRAVVDNMPCKVDFDVVARIASVPSPIVRTLPHCHIDLCISRASHAGDVDKCFNVTSEGYRLSTRNQSVVTAGQDCHVSTHSSGISVVTVTDSAVSDNSASCQVIVSCPARVEHDDIYLRLGDQPVFNPVMFDGDDHIFNNFGTVNWTYEGDLRSVGRKDVIVRHHECSFRVVVNVCPPLVVEPVRSVLPVGYRGYDLQVSGGSGNYTVSVDNPSVLDYVNHHVNTFSEGTANVTVTDNCIGQYIVSVLIDVCRVESIDIILERREVLVNSVFEPVCVAHGSNGLNFTVDVLGLWTYHLVAQWTIPTIATNVTIR